MSDIVRHKRALHRRGRLRQFLTDPATIRFHPNTVPMVEFTDGHSARATCLGCHDAPCMEMTESELSVGGPLRAFPGDPSLSVCPTDAIAWDEAAEAPIVDSEQCIGCGLCATRCPYGAITLGPDGVAAVERDDPDGITTTSTSVESHTSTLRSGTLGSLTAPFLREMPDVLRSLADAQAAILARNLLLVCGHTASIRRKGDTNVRIDGVFRSPTDHIGVFELEIGASPLDSLRALLEDIAVLDNRFNVSVDELIPVSLIARLPSTRSEYYHVIDDINTVLGIQCRTVSLGVLAVAAWHFANLNVTAHGLFTVSVANADLYPSLVELIADLSSTEPYPGAYRPPK